MKSQNRIVIIVQTRIVPIIQAGFDTYPELDVPEILALCRQALEDALREEFTASNPPMILTKRPRTSLEGDMSSPSRCPDIRRMDHDAAVEAMVDWFLSNFEEPAERTSWDEGEYVFIWGGPCHARDELENAFGGVATERAIAAAVDRIEKEGDVWVPSGSRMQPEPVED
jgi:hypothetical protein